MADSTPAEARAAGAEQRSAEANQWRAEVSAAAEEMAAQPWPVPKSARRSTLRNPTGTRPSLALAPQVAVDVAWAETGRVRVTAEKILASFRAGPPLLAVRYALICAFSAFKDFDQIHYPSSTVRRLRIEVMFDL